MAARFKEIYCNIVAAVSELQLWKMNLFKVSTPCLWRKITSQFCLLPFAKSIVLDVVIVVV